MAMLSTRPTRRQENIMIPLCCADLPLDLSGYLKTNRFELCQLDKGSYDAASEQLTLDVVADSRCVAKVVTPADPGNDCAPRGILVDTRGEISYCSDGHTVMSTANIYVYTDGNCGTYEVGVSNGGEGGC